ncbi:S8 family serine peptidase [Marininema halotolerans]|uniref:Peptidase inhibitor I9 n=1 Tax=Marininema halotolerans TaxID=1155944 RepID=A0A1I6UD92_9BACL|nr:S8 family serine peptidase [Marininema halotolerans]SFS99348.1 Peptidase inhibitor I9 [Marininema halotolerans]
MKKTVGFVLSAVMTGALAFSGLTPVSAAPIQSHKVNQSQYYFVQLEDKPVASYQGGVKGYQATKVQADEKLNIHAKDVKKYGSYLKEKRHKIKEFIKKNEDQSTVVEEYSLAFNGVAVKSTAKEAKEIAHAPGVKRVVESKQYRPLMDKSHAIINDIPMWKAGYDGKGVKVAVIDSGIDQNHPFLKDDSLPMPAGFPKSQKDEWLKYTSNKVIVAKVYSEQAGINYDDGTVKELPAGTTGVTPEAIGSHGTHVAGTIAGINGYKDPSGVASSKLSGVAPKAYLGNYNVFPCDDCSAESIYIAKAIEDAVNDGMDVANLSLGGPATTGFDLLVNVVNGASDAGMTMAIAAGNEGPDPMTIGSPGIAEKAITVAAVSNAHFFGKSIKVKVDGEEKVLPVGSSSRGGQISKKLEASLLPVTEKDGLGCDPIDQDLTGKIAVLKRGSCSFTQKATNAQAKGAAGVLLINNSTGDPSSMSVEESVTIPMVMVTQKDGEWILGGQSTSATLEDSPLREFETTNDSQIANFSSRGPTVNYTLKPDVAAVGVNVYSSVVGGGLASYNGTSMATPHVAGAAALLLQAHPDWKPQDVKAALMATAKDPKSESLPVEVGAGIIDVAAASNPAALAYPSSLSFGQLQAKEKKNMEVTLKNPTKKLIMYRIVSDQKSVAKPNKQVVVLKKGKSTTFKVTATATKAGDYQGYIKVKMIGIGKENHKEIRIPYYFHIE